MSLGSEARRNRKVGEWEERKSCPRGGNGVLARPRVMAIPAISGEKRERTGDSAKLVSDKFNVPVLGAV